MTQHLLFALAFLIIAHVYIAFYMKYQKKEYKLMVILHVFLTASEFILHLLNK